MHNDSSVTTLEKPNLDRKVKKNCQFGYDFGITDSNIPNPSSTLVMIDSFEIIYFHLPIISS